MSKRKGGYRRKTRHLLRKNVRDSGKIKLSDYLAEYNVGDKVVLKAEPAVQKGIYHLRFYGRTGIIKSQRGSSYEIQIKDGNKPKIIIAHPVHFKRL